jgi:6-phospho-3-hexuloisomerase
VADKNDRDPAATNLSHDLKQGLDLTAGQRGCRLIHDQQPRRRHQGPPYRDKLLARDGKTAHVAVKVECDAEAFGRLIRNVDDLLATDYFIAVVSECAEDGRIGAIVAARRIVVFGLGREGLQMRGFAMRLFHMGRDIAVWGDMTTPALGAGDLFIASAGPGDLPTAQTLVEVARKGGARTALVTAQAGGGLAKLVDVVTVIPAQTMANDQSATLSVLPMGSLFETAQMIAFELVILKLRPRFSETSETMRARHTNLE